ncbi:hypothetical protein GLIP_0742 [Aliiglaciecola lipolytica E3]|uniref:Uncharacterized protein n=1 Tax=Aliiglaciecola lipolytica E3 TaxID=1127673 RepID=K6Y9R7_9ALTE|nr:hypothetical protein GLIP_0742 [Aliiglaciecola lipolytica E3]
MTVIFPKLLQVLNYFCDCGTLLRLNISKTIILSTGTLDGKTTYKLWRNRT